MEFQSLQSYLEHCFINGEIVTDTMVRDAKQKYRKLYLVQYLKEYRAKYIQISFRISKSEYAVFSKEAKKQGIKTTTLIKNRALKPDTFNNNLLIRKEVLTLIDLLEEAIEEKITIDYSYALRLLERIEKQLI